MDCGEMSLPMGQAASASKDTWQDWTRIGPTVFLDCTTPCQVRNRGSSLLVRPATFVWLVHILTLAPFSHRASHTGPGSPCPVSPYNVTYSGVALSKRCTGHVNVNTVTVSLRFANGRGFRTGGP